MQDTQLKVISDYAEALSDDHGLSKKQATDIIKDIFTMIKGDIELKNDVRIHGFGTFKLKTRAAKKGRNPQTGAEIEIPEHDVITFKQSKASK